MVSGCLMCKNFHFHRYLNTTTRCPLCYLLTGSHFVFESFVQWFRAHARKTVVPGDLNPRTIAVLEDRIDDHGPPVPPLHGVGTPVAKPKVARKSVSICHEVEFIEDYIRNKKGKKKRMEQWPSMEIEEDEIKPLKSILKVDSRKNVA